jgi:integrase
MSSRRAWIVQARKTYGRDSTTKTRRSRWVDLPQQLCDQLQEWITTQGLGPSDRVWVGERGGPLNHKWFYNTRYKPTVVALSEKGLLPVAEVDVLGSDEPRVLTLRFQDLRHTCVALLIAKGAQQYEVMEHLGHTNISHGDWGSSARRPEPLRGPVGIG